MRNTQADPPDQPWNLEADANARLIVAAVNAHENLLAALVTIANTPCDHGPGYCARDVARAAIALLNKE